MAKKRQQKHATQSFGNMVSKSALMQLAPQIEQMIMMQTEHGYNQISAKISPAIEVLYRRVLELEKIIIEGGMVTRDDLAARLADSEDLSKGLAKSNFAVKDGDTVRLTLSIKQAGTDTYKPESRMLVDNIGSGKSLGQEVEAQVLGMNSGDTKEFDIGAENNRSTIKVVVNRVSSLVKTKEEPKDEQSST